MRNGVFQRLFVFAMLLLLCACSTVPYSGRSQFLLTSVEEERSLGAEAFTEILAESKISNDAAMNAAVNRVGKAIVAVVEAEQKTDFEWEFKVIESDVANAFCLPGGKIAVYTGLFPYAANDAELATVMAHEIAHALARHSGEDISHNMLNTLGALLLYATTESEELLALYSVGGEVGVRLPFSRSQETEADYIGMVLMAKAGYDPQAAIPFWEKFGRSDESRLENFFSTHPMGSDRIAAFKKNMPEALKYYEKSAKKGYGVIYTKKVSALYETIDALRRIPKAI